MNWREVSLVGAVVLWTAFPARNAGTQHAPQGAFPHPFQATAKVDVEALKASVTEVMATDDRRLAGLISTTAPIHLVGCPDFAGDVQDTGADRWSIDDPGHVRCRHTGERYPSERYPLNGELKIPNARGEVQVYRYYDGGGEKHRYFFEGAAHAQAARYLAARAYDMARVYEVTKDERYAHKAAVILDRFAQVYPGWPVNGLIGNYANWKVFYPSPPYPVQSGRWGRWIHDELPTELALTYDLIHDSPAFDRLSVRDGADVRQRIERDLFRASVELVRLYPRYVGPSGMNGTAAGLIAIGRAIGEPDYVHDGVNRFRDAFRAWFFRDGMLNSGSTAYLFQMLDALSYPIDLARGYSDPPGYNHPADGERYRDLNLDDAHPLLQKSRATLRSLRLPDGRYTPVHDAQGRSRFMQDEPLERSTPVLLPAYGHALLGRGAGEHQVQAQLHFGYHAGHAHADQLNLLLFARGKEMLSDIGYTHTKLRPWAASTLAHNTVVVDTSNQRMTGGWVPASWTRLDRFEVEKAHSAEPVFGNLLLYDARDEHVQVVEAEGSRGYLGLVPGLKEYRRLVALVGVSPSDAYVVDVFRVRGGRRHLWAVHGSADDEQGIETSFPLGPREGTLLGPGTRYSADTDPELDGESFKGAIFGLIDGLSSATTDKPWSATWRFHERPDVGLKLTMLGGPARTVTRAQAPSIRRAGEDNLKVDRFKMPLLLVEAAGEDLDSTFVAVWEPFSGRPFISQVRRLELEGDFGAAIALAITVGDRTDYVLVDPDGVRLQKVRETDLSFRGRFALVSEANSALGFMHLSDGALVKRNAHRLDGKMKLHGRIAGVYREGDQHGFDVEADLPLGDALKGRLLLARHSDDWVQGYTIASVRARGSRKVILIDGESGLAAAGAGDAYRYAYFPHGNLKSELGTFIVQDASCTAAGHTK